MISLTLHDILKNIITEAVSSDDVLDAIRNRNHVRIRYDDNKEDNGGNSKGSRIIQPFAIGTTKKGYPVVRAFQINGNSRRGAPNWKFFRLDRITSWRPMVNKKFNSAPDLSYGEYNKFGDKTMGTFIDNVKFNDFESPLDRARAERNSQPKMSVKNTNGPINAAQQWKKNVFTSQPNSEKYKNYAANVAQSGDKTQDYWSDYDKALSQLNTVGPVNPSNVDNDYDVNDVDFNEDEFYNVRG